MAGTAGCPWPTWRRSTSNHRPAPAHLTFTSGGDTVALLPVRYTGTAAQADGALRMSRKTEWLALGDGPSGPQYRGLGQRLLATGEFETGLLEVRQIRFDVAPAADAAAA